VATTRGFVGRIEVGRGGLVRATLVNEGGRTIYTVSDIDGDPERFNERLTKVGILRDAMNRVEPVEIETEGDKGGNEIERVARITRDQLLDDGTMSLISGLVLKVLVESRNAIQGSGEAHDNAQVSLIGLDGTTHDARLDLQAPERLVAIEQLRMLSDALESGAIVRLLVNSKDDAEESGTPEIVSVWVGAGSNDDRGEDSASIVCGFVESLGTMLPAAVASAAGSLALARITSGPELSGAGGTVDPAPFTPATLGFLVARGSVVYALLEAAVWENVRVRVRFLELLGRDGHDNADISRDKVVISRDKGAKKVAAEYTGTVETPDADGEGMVEVKGLLLSAELQAPLASASRPVWVHIDREMLDRGPEADCVPGLPSTSLRTRTLRDLRIPYPAEWIGYGCFNHGVYRFQMVAPARSQIVVDGEPLCLFPGGKDGDVVVGYACLEGDHCVTVQIPEYVCDTDFDLDVYRVR
jgi:hypothetical protein